MKTIFVAAALAFVASSLGACAGVKTRTPDDWKTEIGHGFAAHAGDLKACYDSSGLKTKVSISLRLVADKHQGTGGGSNPVTVESVDAGGAPSALVDCVKAAASSIAIQPEDKHKATGSWIVTFDPDVAPSVLASASLGPAPTSASKI